MSHQGDDSSDHSGGSIYAQYLREVEEYELGRKASIEQRGLSIITTSGVLVTLLFGLVSVITNDDAFRLPKAAHGPLGAAIALFVMAAVLGLLTNAPLFYGGVDPQGLDDVLDRRWDEAKSKAGLRVAATRLNLYRRAEKVNSAKAWVLLGAIAAEVAAIGSLALSVSAILRST